MNIFYKFIVEVAKNLHEVCELLKVGFEYVTEMGNIKSSGRENDV